MAVVAVTRGRRAWRGWRACAAVAVLAGCAAGTAPQGALLRATLVDCRSGGAVATPGAANAYECVRNGGQYVSADARADLTAWLPLAQAGDAVAQTRLGYIYEHGLAGAAPDYVAAAHWYRQAVRAEFMPAIVAYAGLVDRGLGVRRDPDAARSLLRRASLGQDWAVPPPRFFLIQPSRVLADQRADESVQRARVPPGARAAGLLARVVASDERLRRINANGTPVEVDAEGYFTLGETLWRGTDRLSLSVTDRRGRTAMLEVEAGLAEATARTAPAPPAAAAPGPTGQRHALLIANQDYRHLPRLATPASDARELQALLEQRYGFRTRLLLNADRRAVLAALAELRERLGADDELIVFYAGHGEIDEATERGYWLPVDARRDDRAPWISSVDVSDQLLGTAARRVLLIIDSCFAGSFNRRALPAAQAEVNAWANLPPRGAAAAARSRWAMTSGGLEPVADGGGGRHSVYAAALLDVLRNLQGPAPARRVVDEVHARFRYRAVKLGLDQRPRYAPVKEAGHQDGEFDFVPRTPPP